MWLTCRGWRLQDTRGDSTEGIKICQHLSTAMTLAFFLGVVRYTWTLNQATCLMWPACLVVILDKRSKEPPASQARAGRWCRWGLVCSMHHAVVALQVTLHRATFSRISMRQYASQSDYMSQWPLDKRCRLVCKSFGELGQDKDQGTLVPISLQSRLEWVDFSGINCQRLRILWSKS